MGFKEWIIPQDRVFYDLLEKHAAYARDATEQFKALLANWGSLDMERQKLKDIEDQADRVGHEIFDRLNRTFITPMDREDIARLAHSIDDVVDAVYAAANRMVIYELEAPTPALTELIDVLEDQVRELVAAIRSLRNARTMGKVIPQHSIEIHRLENLADSILNRRVAELFQTDNALHIIKHKEIYELLEAATDRCEDVADILQDIRRKHG